MPKQWDGVVSQHINRKLSRPIACFLARRTGVTPNQVTFLSFIIGVLSGVSFFLRQSILGGILAQIASILDGVDGDLATLTGKTSKFGGLLDPIFDRYSDAAILLGMVCNVSAVYEQSPPTLIIAISALVGSLMVSYSRARVELDLKVVLKSGISGYAANRDVRLFIIMIGGILNQVFPSLIVLAVLTNLVVVKRVYDARKLARYESSTT